MTVLYVALRWNVRGKLKQILVSPYGGPAKTWSPLVGTIFRGFMEEDQLTPVEQWGFRHMGRPFITLIQSLATMGIRLGETHFDG